MTIPTAILGDALEVLPTLDPDSVDAVVTDPPYGLGFMRSRWDTFSRQKYQRWCEAWARELLRVVKPGGHLVSFGGTRTHHRLTCGVEDAGWEIRDELVWLYGQGFPKSLDVSKAIDRAVGAEREVVGSVRCEGGSNFDAWRRGERRQDRPSAHRRRTRDLTAPATSEAAAWEGWGTALKPGHEPILLARRPLLGTVVENVLEHGTGALHVDACRLPRATKDRTSYGVDGDEGAGSKHTFGFSARHRGSYEPHARGRWPSNVVVDPEVAAELDVQSPRRYGGPSRFFYCAKATPAERGENNDHPTVKPLALMRWLVRLVCPPNGVVLDPFAGSGSTLIAATEEGFSSLGIEVEEHFVEVTRERLRTRGLAARG